MVAGISTPVAGPRSAGTALALSPCMETTRMIDDEGNWVLFNVRVDEDDWIVYSDSAGCTADITEEEAIEQMGEFTELGYWVSK